MKKFNSLFLLNHYIDYFYKRHLRCDMMISIFYVLFIYHYCYVMYVKYIISKKNKMYRRFGMYRESDHESCTLLTHQSQYLR